MAKLHPAMPDRWSPWRSRAEGQPLHNPHRAPQARSKRVDAMRRLGLLWRNAWWKLVLLKILLYSSAASGQLTLATSGLNFGSVQVGSSSAVSTLVSNTSKSNITISQVSATGTGFSFSGPSLPITLAPQQNVNLYVTFAPQSRARSPVTSTRPFNLAKHTIM